MTVESRQADAARAALQEVVAIDARCLWNRDRSPPHFAGVPGQVAIDARWLWNETFHAAKPTLAGNRDRCSIAVGSRRFLTRLIGPSLQVAIDARCLWDRDKNSDDYDAAREGPRPGPLSRRDSHARWLWVSIPSSHAPAREALAIDARWLWIRTVTRLPPNVRWAVESIRDRCSVALERRLALAMPRAARRHCRDRCSVALERRP